MKTGSPTNFHEIWSCPIVAQMLRLYLYEVYFLFPFRPLFSDYNITNPTISLWMALHLQLYK